MSDLAKRIQALSSEQRDMLLRRLNKKDVDVLIGVSPQRGQTELFPLSPTQERLWFLDQLTPGNGTYIIPLAFHFTGSLNISALYQCFEELVKRHEILRTVFVSKDGRPRQVVRSHRNFSMSTHDLRFLSEQDRKSESSRLITVETKRPFDLEVGPLFRVILLLLSDCESVLLITMHHIIADGWSVGVILQEVSILYQAYDAGTTPSLPPLKIQYLDYAYWQQQRLQSEELKTHLLYWKQKLQDATSNLQLPFDYPRPSEQSFQGAVFSFKIPLSITNAVKAHSIKKSITPFMLFLTVFKILLLQYSNQNDIIVGTPIANRISGDVERLIGFFANTLVLRSRLSLELTFNEMLSFIKEITLDAYAHQAVPFERIVEELRPERSLARNPLFQVMFILQSAFSEDLKLSGITVATMPIETHFAKFDLTLSLTETINGYAGEVEYNTDLFQELTISRMSRHFQFLLERLLKSPDISLSQLELLAEEEKEKLLANLNGREANFLRQKGIHRLFEEQVALSPQAEAVIFEDERVSYKELNERANRTAHYLQSFGVGPETLVGICLKRSVEMVVAVLSVLKAGGAYVPLDPHYPRERLAFMLQDSNVRFLLSESSLLADLPEHNALVIPLDKEWMTIAKCTSENVSSPVNERNAAYVIYTSGSTGKPKGVVIEHRNTTMLLYWARNTFSKQEIAQVLASTSLCFDLSIFELFVPLTCGGTVVMAENILSLLTKKYTQNVTLVNTVPSAMTELLNANALPSSVKVVNLAGEALQGKLVQQVYLRSSTQRVCNLYGPTEDTTYSTFAIIDRHNSSSPSIGFPITATQVYILDKNLHLVSLGGIGEVYIGGSGLSRGYINRPDITAEKFIPNPFSKELGNRLYRTGDLARFLADGSLEYLGRVDQQVKLHGFRIELGEIEVTLNQHPAFQESIVTVQMLSSGEQALFAYFVSTQTEPPSDLEMRQFLQKYLPKHMVPSSFVAIDKFPLTPTGKIDRQALPYVKGRMLEKHFSERPRDTLEIRLTEMWEEILGIKDFGIRADFFELGGHSLQAVRFVSMVQERLGKSLPYSALFETGTIEQIAHVLRLQGQRPRQEGWSPLVEIQPTGSRPPLFCIHASMGHVVNYIELAKCLGKDQPVYGLQSRHIEAEDLWGVPQDPPSRIEVMAKTYIEAIQTIQPNGPYLLAGYSAGGLIAFEMAQQLHVQGQSIAFLALLDTVNSLAGWPKTLDDPIYWYWRFGDVIPLSESYLRQLTSTGQLNYVYEHLREAGKLPFRGQQPQGRYLLKVEKGNMEAVFYYKPKVYKGKITLFKAKDQSGGIFDDQFYGWEPYSSEKMEIHEVPGDHFSLLKEPNSIKILADELAACISSIL